VLARCISISSGVAGMVVGCRAGDDGGGSKTSSTGPSDGSSTSGSGNTTSNGGTNDGGTTSSSGAIESGSTGGDVPCQLEESLTIGGPEGGCWMGAFVAFVAEKDANRALQIMCAHDVSAGSACIGRVIEKAAPLVTLKSSIGASRILDMPSGEQLPRIC